MRSLPILSVTGKLTEELVGSEELDYLQICYLKILINKTNSAYYLFLIFKPIKCCINWRRQCSARKCHITDFRSAYVRIRPQLKDVTYFMVILGTFSWNGVC